MAATNRNPKIAIIGAGVAGLTAAHRLRENGYQHITLYEREPTVGGKVCSVLHEGRAYELGALWSTPRYKVIGKFAQEVGATRRGATLPDVLEAGKLEDYATTLWRQFGITEIAASLLRLGHAFLTIRGIGRPDLVSFSGAPAEDFQQFAQRRGFGPLARVSGSFASGCGYLHNDTVPAPYLMKLMHIFIDVLLLDVTGLSKRRAMIFEKGWQSLWQELARKFDVRLASCIASIRRRDDQVEITTEQGAEAYDRLILACPLDTCGAFLDLGDEERDLFARIRTVRYKVTLVAGENLPHASMADNAVRERTGHVNLVARQHAGANVFTVYQQLAEGMSDEAATALMHEDVQAMGGSIARVVTSQTWKYFPHVSSEDIRDGFYSRLDGLQGVRGTYYMGGLMNLEAVEHTARFSVALVDRHFQPAAR